LVQAAEDVRDYGRRWVDRTWERVAHLYLRATEPQGEQLGLDHDASAERATGRPIAYLWTRTVPCPNTSGGAHELPLVRQTWLSKTTGRYAALRPIVDRAARALRWEVVEAGDAAGLGFDPAGFSSRGRASCLICGAAVDANYVKGQGLAGRMGITPLAAVLVNSNGRGRHYLPAGTYPEPSVRECEAVLAGLDVKPPDEPLPPALTGGMCTVYGLTRFSDLFTPRQLATLCAFAHGVREAHAEIVEEGMDPHRAEAVCAYLALAANRVLLYGSTQSVWHTTRDLVTNALSRQALPMTWDFAEANPFGGSGGDAGRFVSGIADIVSDLANSRATRVDVQRTSATQLPYHDNEFDAVITDPPYYDSISYSDLSDFFYVWLKRSVGFLFEEHFAGELAPKRREAIVAPYRHGGDKSAARAFYEQEMAAAFAEAHRVLKPGAPLVCVYAHKTTLGWASLVEALRQARFTMTEAWPIDTEMTTALKKDTASLASSIFLVARRRDADSTGSYHHVLAELDGVIAERLERLTAAGVAGSDLVIAAIGAGLAPFTRYATVELPSGEPVSADRFLEEVQSRVLDAILSGLGVVDPATRYYVVSRYLFGWADIEFDEANNLARTAGIELGDGIAHGPPPTRRHQGQSRTPMRLLRARRRRRARAGRRTIDRRTPRTAVACLTCFA
jgi:putative DNA methylase